MCVRACVCVIVCYSFAFIVAVAHGCHTFTKRDREGTRCHLFARFLGVNLIYISNLSRFGGFVFPISSCLQLINYSDCIIITEPNLIDFRAKVQMQLIKSFSDFSHVSISNLPSALRSALSFLNWFLAVSLPRLSQNRSLKKNAHAECVHFSLVINAQRPFKQMINYDDAAACASPSPLLDAANGDAAHT